MIKIFKFILICITIPLYITQNNSIATPSSIRTINMQKYCQNSKFNLITSDERNLNNNFFTNLGSYFTSQTNMLPRGILNRDTSIITNQLEKLGFLTILVYASPFYVGLIILLSLFLLSICFAVCPRSCPPRRCQKSQQLFYTKKQLVLPNIYAIIIFCLIVGFCITGIYYSLKLNNSLQRVECGFSIVLDDIINGDIYSNQSNSFLGLTALVNSTNLILLSLKNSFSQLNLTNIFNKFNNNTINILNDLSLLSNGVTPNSTFNLTYNSFSPPYLGTIKSSFGSFLGNPSNLTSLVGQIYSNVLFVNNSINNFSQFLNYIQSFIIDNLQSIVNQLSKYNQYAFSTNSILLQFTQQLDSYKPYLIYAPQAYFGFILFSILIGVISIIIISCKKIQWKKTLYSLYFIVWLASLLSFLVSCIMIVLIPFLFFECKAANQSFNSGLSFTSFMTQIGMSINDASTLSTCIHQNGDFLMNSNNIPNLSKTFSEIINNITNFQNNINNNSINLNNLLINTTSIILSYAKGSINDVISDFNTNLWFQNVANQTQFMSVCSNNTNYLADSFVPSTSATSLNFIPCASGTILSNNCTTINTCPNGCIDLNNIMSNQINLTSFQNNIKTKFPGTCGMTISSEFTYLYNNWFLPRTNNQSGIQSIYNRFMAVNNSVVADTNLLIQNLNSINNQNNVYLNDVAYQLNNLINNKTGILTRRNCTVIGDDIILVKDTICISVFNNLYILLMVIGTISYLLMIGLCCMVCSRFRYLKQQQKYEQTDIKNKIILEKKAIPEKTYTQGQQQ